jgi:hypothetical protein
MAGTKRVDGADQHRPHFAADAIAVIGQQTVADEGQWAGSSPLTEHTADAGPIIVRNPDEIPDTDEVERHLHRSLMALQQVTFSSLVVRRIEDGVCLQGVLECNDSVPDVCQLARQVAGVENVLNRLIIRRIGGADPQESVE